MYPSAYLYIFLSFYTPIFRTIQIRVSSLPLEVCQPLCVARRTYKGNSQLRGAGFCSGDVTDEIRCRATVIQSCSLPHAAHIMR